MNINSRGFSDILWLNAGEGVTPLSFWPNEYLIQNGTAPTGETYIEYSPAIHISWALVPSLDKESPMYLNVVKPEVQSGLLLSQKRTANTTIAFLQGLHDLCKTSKAKIPRPFCIPLVFGG